MFPHMISHVMFVEIGCEVGVVFISSNGDRDGRQFLNNVSRLIKSQIRIGMRMLEKVFRQVSRAVGTADKWIENGVVTSVGYISETVALCNTYF